MDENHYNFIKRPPKVATRKHNDSRPILNKIENFQRPTVRPNTVDADRIYRLRRMKQDQSQYLQDSIQQIELTKEPTKIHTASKIKRVRSRKTQPRKCSLEPNRHEQSQRVDTQQTQQKTPEKNEIQVQKLYCSTHIDQEKNAVDNLCHLSLNQNNGEQAEHYLSGWTNSYPLKQNAKKLGRLPIPVNRSTSCYPQQNRYRMARAEPISQLDKSVSNSYEDNYRPKLDFECLPQEIRRAISHSYPNPPPPSTPAETQDDMPSRLASGLCEEKIIFFRNGIINQLRRKQQMGRHLVLEEWRHELNRSAQGQYTGGRA